MQGAQRMALTPAHCGHTAGTPPLSRQVDISGSIHVISHTLLCFALVQ